MVMRVVHEAQNGISGIAILTCYKAKNGFRLKPDPDFLMNLPYSKQQLLTFYRSISNGRMFKYCRADLEFWEMYKYNDGDKGR